MAVVALFLGCLFCPLLEGRDPGDNIFQNGNDTESSLAILVACVALTYALARAVNVISQVFSELVPRIAACCVRWIAIFEIGTRPAPFLPSSPPLSSLRI